MWPGAGIALRVPTPNVSIVDLVLQVEKKTFAEEVNDAFRSYAGLLPPHAVGFGGQTPICLFERLM